MDRCSAWKLGSGAPTQNEIDATILDSLKHHWGREYQSFDVTASVGLLSQLIEMAIGALGEQHVNCLELLTAVRLRHMQLLFESLRPGGRGVLVTEIVSSRTCPELARTRGGGLKELLTRTINERNFFTGLNPAVLESLWRHSPQLAPLVEQVEPSHPWLWDFGPRFYACWALSGVRRRDDGIIVR
jgi:hypothetical protein